MKYSLIIVFLFLSLSCFGQNEDKLRFYKDMPHYSSAGVVWQRDTICYERFLPNIDLYKSSNKEYPYLYKHIDTKKEVHYFFIRQKDINIEGKKIQIRMFDESGMDVNVYKMSKDSVFSFQLNNP